MQMKGSRFSLEEPLRIILPAEPSENDWLLARELAGDLSDRRGLNVRIEKTARLPVSGRFILMGAVKNPLVKQYAALHGLAVTPTSPGKEGYILEANGSAAVVTGSDERGAFYGLQSLRQLIGKTEAGVGIPGIIVKDWPYKPFRGIKLYLPGRDNIGYFKRFVRDFMALYKYNELIVELNGAMRLDRHPEVNAGWIEFGKDMNYTRRDRSWGPGRQTQDSANADVADFGVLEKDEVADLVRYARQHYIDVIPEIPSLTHSYYLLARHRELAEVPDAEWPDTYCPSEPKVYDLLFDVLDEYIEVTKPSVIHIGHDEWRVPVGVCQRCKGKDPTELYAADLNRIYAHLHSKNIGVAIWGDHLIEPLRGKKVQHVANARGTPYDTPGGLSAEQVNKLIPKDILIFNWFWDNQQAEGLRNGIGEPDEIALSNWGFRQVYGNMEPHIANFDRRAARQGIIGGAPSSWAATTELNFGKDLMFTFLGCANLLWSTDRPDMDNLAVTVQERLPGIRRSLGAAPLPSADEPVEQLSGSSTLPVAIGADVSSLIFVHSCRTRARNAFAYTATWDPADTAQLVGWYEVVYEDGLVQSVPLRYGLNILEEDWLGAHAPKSVAYKAEMLPRGDGKADFAYEWINPRFGKPIREVRLHSVSDANPVTLAGLRVVRKRTAPEPKPLRMAQ
jgi:hexosaminidase